MDDKVNPKITSFNLFSVIGLIYWTCVFGYNIAVGIDISELQAGLSVKYSITAGGTLVPGEPAKAAMHCCAPACLPGGWLGRSAVVGIAVSPHTEHCTVIRYPCYN